MENQQEKRILNMNGLFYQVPPPLSTTLNRTYKKNYSQRTEYGPGDTIVFDMNVSGFVDPELSFIKLTVEAVAQDSTFGTRQSVANLFREIRIQSKNGAELDRIEHANDWVNHFLLACEDGRKPEEYSLNWGHNSGTMVAGQQYTYTFPLYLISGLFRPYSKQKIPPQLLSGARIEIQLESANKALISTAGASYKVIKPEIIAQEHAQNDNTNKIIVEQSANNGLEYLYPRIFSVVENSAASEFNTQVKKAVSQACACYVIPKPTADQTDITKNSFSSLNGTGNFQQYQIRVGSNYYPYQAVEDIASSHEISSLVCAKGRNKQSPLITSNSYRNLGEFHMSVPLKKEHDISASGLAINNSAALEVRYVSGNTTDKTIYIFMEYICLARTFLSQTSVKI